MAIQTTSNLTNSIRTQYVADYLSAAYGQRLYDQLAVPVPSISMDEAIKGSTVQYDFLSGMAPGLASSARRLILPPRYCWMRPHPSRQLPVVKRCSGLKTWTSRRTPTTAQSA